MGAGGRRIRKPLADRGTPERAALHGGREPSAGDRACHEDEVPLLARVLRDEFGASFVRAGLVRVAQLRRPVQDDAPVSIAIESVDLERDPRVGRDVDGFAAAIGAEQH